MKKNIFAAMVVLATAFASCETIETDSRSFGELDLTFDVADPVSDTRAIKSAWEEGDEILIVFYQKVEKGQQAKLKYTSGQWTLVQKPSDLGLEAGSTISFDAIHFPGSIGYDKYSNTDYEEQLGYAGGNVRLLRYQTSGKLTADGVLPLGTIALDSKLSGSEYQIVVPGINASDSYTMAVTCNGHLSSIAGRENTPYSFGCAYAQVYFPYFNSYGNITFGGGLYPVKGVANADGVAFTCYYNDPSASYDPEVADTNPYKYVFSLYDGKKYYYYTIPKASEKVIAAGKAIKLPTFDGKGSKTNWKTSL